MNQNENQISAVPVESSELNQGSTASPEGRGNVRQMRLTQTQIHKHKLTQTHKHNKKNGSKMTNLNIGTYNVRTLSDDCHLACLENELENIKWDVIGVSEMRRPGENVTELGSHHVMYNKGNDQKHGGVGFFVHKTLKPNIQEFHATSDRVVSVTIQINKRYKIKIIQVYAPTSLSTQEALEEFYDDLQTEIQRKKAHYNIILGDFNAKVGDGDEDCVGSFGHGVRNERGSDLVNFAVGNNLKIVNTFFKKRPSRKWTWHSPNFETYNEIDYVMTDKLNIVKNIEVLNRVNVGSDHRMVRCRVQIDTKRERQKLFHSKPEPLRITKQFENDFKLELKNRYAVLEEEQNITKSDSNNKEMNIQDLSNNIIQPMIAAGKNWKTSSKMTEKFSDTTKTLMEKRRNLKKPSNTREKIEQTELNKLIQKKQRQDLRNLRATTIQEVIKQGKGFKMAKRKLNRKRLQFTGIQEEDHTITKDRERIIDRTREFYIKLYSSTRQQQQPEQADPKLEHHLQDFPIIKPWEIEEAIKQTKKGKAPGPDNVTIDLIEVAGELIYNKLATLFSECLRQSKIPDEWNEAIIILLHKKGDQTNISNYRPISLLNNIYKLFTRVITSRITRILDENQPREQAGFRKGFSTIDHLQAVNQLIEKCTEYKIPLAVGLVDYNKAFDSVETPYVIKALQEQGIDPVYVNVFRHIYSNAKSFIRLHKDSEPFQLDRGVRQGDTASPKLFTACLEGIFKKLDWEEKGIKIDGEHLSHLRFADDIIIFANSLTELQQMLKELNKASLEVGLSMNLKKTKIMLNEHIDDENENQEIKIDDNIIEQVEDYIYLGQRISAKTSAKEEEIKRRITLGWQAFGRASAVFTNKDTPLVLKRQLYDQCITPTVTYGAETWNLTKKLALKIRSMQRAHERKMMNLTWRDRKTATWVREQTKVRDILETIYYAKFNWAGHVVRREDNRWSTKLTLWQPRGHTRNRGRQRTRWRDDLDSYQKHWQRVARERDRWKQLRKAFIQQRISTTG